MAEKTPKPPTFPKFVMVWRSFCPQATQHMQEQRLWKIADIDGDLNVALGPAKAKFFISIRMWHQRKMMALELGATLARMDAF